MSLGIIAQKEVHHLLNDQIPSFDGQHHLGEETRYIDTESHVGDDFFHNVAFAIAVFFGAEGSEEGAELVYFSFAGFGEVVWRSGG